MTFRMTTRGAGTLIMAEFRCAGCGVFEELVESPAPDEIECPDCGSSATWTISAPKPKVWSVTPYATVRGGDMKDRPPGMLDTRPLAEGMSMTEWKKVQREDQRRRRHKQLIDKGIIQKKVIVG